MGAWLQSERVSAGWMGRWESIQFSPLSRSAAILLHVSTSEALLQGMIQEQNISIFSGMARITPGLP